jgi:fumarate reductase flavoprotein subunit
MTNVKALSLSVALALVPALSAYAADIQKMNTDVVVIGGGGTGLSAAASAHQNGAKVILLEKLAFVGGSSALSGGALAGGHTNPQQRAATPEVSDEGFANIWIKDQERSFPGGDAAMPDANRIRRVMKDMDETINWMESTIGHKFAVPRPFGYGGPNYAHAPAEAPIPASGRGSTAAGGRFVIQAFKTYLDKEGVPVMTGTRAQELITDGKGRVVGVRAKKGQQEIEIRAKAVVLGTGGFARNKELLQQYTPSYAPYTAVSNATPGATGDGIIMAKKVGAAGFKDGWVMGLCPVSPKRELNNTFRTKNVYKDDVFVNQDGVRFVKEDLPYIVDPIAEQKTAWAILDSSDAAKAELLSKESDPTIVAKGATWKELAKAMGVPEAALTKTMENYNRYCVDKKDPEFNKVSEFLVPVAKAPFFAVRVIPSTMGTMGGVKTNDKFQVLRADGSVIKGLYAGGETANRPFYQRVYTSGTGLGLAYTSGRIAGANAAKEK